MFEEAARLLAERHDRQERLKKEGRDICIESKRIIFGLHRIASLRNNDATSILQEAKSKLDQICSTRFTRVAQELADSGQPYQFQFCYNYGLQEFIEAYAFYTYLSQKRLFTYEDLLDVLNINVRTSNGLGKQQVLLSATEYLLGLSDVSGELMRLMVSTASGSSNAKYADVKQNVFDICHFLQDLYTIFVRLASLSAVQRCRQYDEKVKMIFESVLKAEKTCYMLVIREGEFGSADNEFAYRLLRNALMGSDGDADEPSAKRRQPVESSGVPS